MSVSHDQFVTEVGTKLRSALQDEVDREGGSITLSHAGKSVTLTSQARANADRFLAGAHRTPVDDDEDEFGNDTSERLSIAIPLDSEFETKHLDFLPAPDIESIARALRDEKPQLSAIEGLKIAFLWRRNGGASAGKCVLGKCLKTPPMVKPYQESTFTVWLAADHCRDFGLNDHQFEALIFHELLHADLREVEVKDRKTGAVETEYRPTVVGHDLEMFHAEVQEYGLWTSELRRASDTFAQTTLPFGESVPFGGAA